MFYTRHLFFLQYFFGIFTTLLLYCSGHHVPKVVESFIVVYFCAEFIQPCDIVTAQLRAVTWVQMF